MDDEIEVDVIVDAFDAVEVDELEVFELLEVETEAVTELTE